jgi:NADH dehydrogenase
MDRLVTLFGGGGFLGRYVAQALFDNGARVRIVQRNPGTAVFLKPLASLGQLQIVQGDVTDAARVRAAAAGSHAVVNLVGVLKGRFRAVHVEGARNVADAAAAAGAEALVQISAIGAEPESESLYFATKGEGEIAARAAFPGATIVRPSLLFGREDNFVNRFAGLARIAPVLPVIRPAMRIQPVYAADAGRAIAAAALNPATHAGTTYELGGPQVLTMRALMQWVCRTTERDRPLVDVPDAVARLFARGLGWLPGAPLTWQQWLMLQKDSVVSSQAAGLEAFGIPKTPLIAVAEGWLTAYRRHGRFAAKQPY